MNQRELSSEGTPKATEPRPSSSQEWNRDMNVVGITIGLMVIRNIAPYFAERMNFLDFCSDKTQFVFLIITFLAGTAASIVKNNRMRRHLSFMYTSAIFFWTCMALIVVNLVLLVKMK